ncbi:membrane dipeptidase [Agaricicola taiwanensis]|uniref:Membrane dipeptidase n=1 Tax=Agaricicola taiwanensis TaxID=591372 RepID=A0A8J2YFB4_9RHOB|nr:dipeptidase [Agaricicola taiwanensis]GGE29188.1 membrane dipeptidase [Agaricicola taiwanensis]
MSDIIPIFDGHNDVLLRLRQAGLQKAAQRFIRGGNTGHLDLPRAREGGFAGGLFALYAPSRRDLDFNLFRGASYEVPLPAEVPLEDARTAMIEMAALLIRIERESKGALSLCRTTTEIEAAMARGSLAAVMHIEGAEAIDPDLSFLEVLYAAGLRSIGPVWSRNNIFGDGVPMRFPSSPNINGGLTEAGEALVRACNRMGILVDVSHMTERGFWDVARISEAPLVATHSNLHSFCPSSRNLTERQLDAIRDSDGLVGVNFATCFLREDGRMDEDTDLDVVVRHVDGLIDRLGETRVGFGSDYDGAIVPRSLKSVADLQSLIRALRDHGYDDGTIQRLASGNWMRVLRQTIG